jgi:hypothetical protein
MDQNILNDQPDPENANTPPAGDDNDATQLELTAPASNQRSAHNFANLPDLPIKQNFPGSSRKFVAYTVKLPAEQLAALQSIWLELKRLYGAHSPDKSGMIQHAITDWLRRWDGPERQALLEDLLEIRQDTRRRQYKK